MLLAPTCCINIFQQFVDASQTHSQTQTHKYTNTHIHKHKDTKETLVPCAAGTPNRCINIFQQFVDSGTNTLTKTNTQIHKNIHTKTQTHKGDIKSMCCWHKSWLHLLTIYSNSCWCKSKYNSFPLLSQQMGISSPLTVCLKHGQLDFYKASDSISEYMTSILTKN